MTSNKNEMKELEIIALTIALKYQLYQIVLRQYVDVQADNIPKARPSLTAKMIKVFPHDLGGTKLLYTVKSI